eukprot:g17597.t1
MMAIAAARYGLHVHIFAPEENASAGEVASMHTQASYEDKEALSEFAEDCDVVTYEFENIPRTSLDMLSGAVPLRPGIASLEISQDRLVEKQFLEKIGLPVAPYRPIDEANDIGAAHKELGGDTILKTRRFGYDGKGQARLKPGAMALLLAACQTAGLNEGGTLAASQAVNIASLSEVISSNPQDPGAYNMRGTAYGQEGRYNDALQDFNQALALNPNFYQALANRALVHRELGNQSQALADYTAAIAANPAYDAAYVGRGNIYREAGRFQEAMADYERAILLNSSDARAYYNRALIFQAQNNHILAIEDLTTAIGFNPNATEPYMARGLSYLSQRDFGAAIEDFDAVLGRDSRNVDAWINRGIAYEAAGDNENALVSYQRALTIDENSRIAQQGLGRVN